MRSAIIISTLLGLLICIVPLHAKPNPQGEDDGCACTTRTATTNDADRTIIGNCLTEDKADDAPEGNKFFCYLKTKDGKNWQDDPCCQNPTRRFRNHCVNYDLCNVDDYIDATDQDARITNLGR